MASTKSRERKRQQRAQQRRARMQQERKRAAQQRKQAGAAPDHAPPDELDALDELGLDELEEAGMEWEDPYPAPPVSRPTHRHNTLAVPRPERCRPPVFLDTTGHVIEDPRAILGLPAGPVDPERVRTALRDALIASPPERDPEGARRVREARDLLLDPKAWMARELGELRVPDAAAWGLAELEPPAVEQLPAASRLLGQIVLYAMLEDNLQAPAPTPPAREAAQKQTPKRQTPQKQAPKGQAPPPSPPAPAPPPASQEASPPPPEDRQQRLF